jgi:hypothetical protein
MATPAEHRWKALRNERLIRDHALGRGDFADLAVTVMFYAALHWIRALSPQEGFVISNYATERIALRDVPSFRNAPHQMALYRELKDSSQDARYEMTGFTESDYRDLDRDC